MLLPTQPLALVSLKLGLYNSHNGVIIYFRHNWLHFFFFLQYIKIPAAEPLSPSSLHVFTFYLSSEGKDQPQASFDCIYQYVSRSVV